MALTLETGSGGDTMLSLADFEAYCEDVGYDTGDFTDPQMEQALRRASTYISGSSWAYKGLRVGGRDQVQAWPRSGVSTNEGWAVDSDSIPREVEDAVAEAAWYELNNPNALLPTVVLAERVASESVGPISVEYSNKTNDVNASKPVLTIVADLLSPLLQSKQSGVVARADRG